MKALIIGGGIGGLTAALCLHKIGVEVTASKPNIWFVLINLVNNFAQNLVADLQATTGLGYQSIEASLFEEVKRVIGERNIKTITDNERFLWNIPCDLLFYGLLFCCS